MILHVISAEYAGDYKIKVKFNDFVIDEFTIIFSNGVDFAPEFIKSLC